MTAPFVIDGYAIVTVEGMIADAHAAVPDSLKNEADQAYFSSALDAAALVVHGRHSHEGHPNSPRRRRFWLTRKVADLQPVAGAALEWLWNPAGVSLADAARRIGLERGTIAALGGTEVYDLFLPVYRAFHLSRAGNAHMPVGAPVFSAVRDGLTPEQILARSGLKQGATRVLDAENEVTTTTWERRL